LELTFLLVFKKNKKQKNATPRTQKHLEKTLVLFRQTISCVNYQARIYTTKHVHLGDWLLSVTSSELTLTKPDKRERKRSLILSDESAIILQKQGGSVGLYHSKRTAPNQPLFQQNSSSRRTHRTTPLQPDDPTVLTDLQEP